MTNAELPRLDYDTPSTALVQLLEWLEEHIDTDHVAAVEERHVKALSWEPVDHPPIILSAPVPQPLSVYPYPETFADPTKMLVNELIGPYAAMGPSPSIVNSVVIKDDLPLQIRSNYGVGLFSSLFGAETVVMDVSFPWVHPIGIDALRRKIGHGVPEIDSELMRRALDTMAYYQEALAPYPKCRQAIHITQPDLQGPFENAVHLWGSDIFYAFRDDRQFLEEAMDVITESWALATQKVAAASTEAACDGFIYLHFTIVKGQGLIKTDSAILISGKDYAELIQPAFEKALGIIGSGGIHWCGKGDQWRSQILDTKGVTCLDWGDPAMMALDSWAPVLRQHQVSIDKMQWKFEDFTAADPVKLFPTGASFTVVVDSFDQASSVLPTSV